MLNTKNVFKILLLLPLFAFLSSCDGGSSSSNGVLTSKKAGVNEIYVHLSSDLDKINPIISTSANASLVERFLFYNLLESNPSTLGLTNVVATSRPTIEEIEADVFGVKMPGLAITYNIRPEAVWDDGTPITAKDYEFALKVVKNPKVDCESLRPYFEFIYDMKIDPNDPKKFTIYTKDKYILSESVSSGYLYPKHLYDKEGLMDNFTVNQLSNPANLASLSGNLNIIKFAEMFNSEDYSRNPDFVNGCGPYRLKEWSTGQRIILEKKKDWWGEQFVGKEIRFDNYPDRIIYEIIVDNTTAVTAMKDESIDVMHFIPSKDFVDLEKNERFQSLFNLHTPIAPSYSYIAFNLKDPKMEDKRVRQAMSMALDYETIEKVISYGYSERTVGPIHPNKPHYNKDIPLYPYDLNKAKALLDESGWIDTDGNGVREKKIDGQIIELKLEFLLPAGSEAGENIALMLKNNLGKLGVQIDIVQKEWTVFLEQIKGHDFDMCSLSWVMGPELDDFKQIWHTDSYNGGSNYTGFGNVYTDELIDKIRYELDAEVRTKYYLEFQEILHEEAPYIFMFTPKNKMAFHKRFDNANPYLLRPGHFENEFKLNPNFGAAAAK
jgi:peptide/nickel transport system substrate-binding protein